MEIVQTVVIFMIFIIFILKQFTDPSWWAGGPWSPANLPIEVNSLIHRHQVLSHPRHITGKNLKDLRGSNTSDIVHKVGRRAKIRNSFYQVQSST